MAKEQSRDLVSNRKAFFNYEILESIEAGIVLLGSEIKSLRAGGGSLQDGFATIREGEVWLINVSIAPYKYGSGVFGHEERRERKLLLHKNEIIRLSQKMAEKGFSLIPLALYLKNGKVKVKIALAKGKKKYDQRKKIQEEEVRGQMRRAMGH